MKQMRTFGENVSAAMHSRGLSRSDVATAMGVSENQVIKYLKATNVELDTIFRLAKVLTVSIESLCRGIDPDYDAMRSEVRTPAQFEELWASIADQRDRDSLWYFLMRLAGATTSSDGATAATASEQ